MTTVQREYTKKWGKHMKKTSMNIPPATWQQFRIEALKEGRTAQEVLTERRT
jgi:hypothetical protein